MGLCLLFCFENSPNLNFKTVIKHEREKRGVDERWCAVSVSLCVFEIVERENKTHNNNKHSSCGETIFSGECFAFYFDFTFFFISFHFIFFRFFFLFFPEKK